MKVFGYTEACELLKTGQTTSYHAGDDGDLELGLDHNYEVKTTGNQSGTTNITINGKTHALSNNTVIEHNTWMNGKQLEWARHVPASVIGPAADGKLFWEQWTLGPKTDISFDAITKEIRSAAAEFSTAALCAGRKFTISGSAFNNTTFTVVSITTSVCVVSETVVDEGIGASVSLVTVDDLIWDFVDQANANSLGGYTDWRIPNYKELQSLVDSSKSNPCIDATTFPLTTNHQHWTSSTRHDFPTHALYVRFRYGSVYSEDKQLFKYVVRLVRS